MAHSQGWARGRGSLASRRIQPPDTPTRHHRHLTPEQHAFVLLKIEAGLTNIEICRVFFREYGREINPSVAHNRRKRDGGTP